MFVEFVCGDGYEVNWAAWTAIGTISAAVAAALSSRSAGRIHNESMAEARNLQQEEREARIADREAEERADRDVLSSLMLSYVEGIHIRLSALKQSLPRAPQATHVTRDTIPDLYIPWLDELEPHIMRFKVIPKSTRDDLIGLITYGRAYNRSYVRAWGESALSGQVIIDIQFATNTGLSMVNDLYDMACRVRSDLHEYVYGEIFIDTEAGSPSGELGSN